MNTPQLHAWPLCPVAPKRAGNARTKAMLLTAAQRQPVHCLLANTMDAQACLKGSPTQASLLLLL